MHFELLVHPEGIANKIEPRHGKMCLRGFVRPEIRLKPP